MGEYFALKFPTIVEKMVLKISGYVATPADMVTPIPVWCLRCSDCLSVLFQLSEDLQIDYESYSWKKLDASADETKKLVEEYLSWEGDFGGRKFNQGKIFKWTILFSRDFYCLRCVNNTWLLSDALNYGIGCSAVSFLDTLCAFLR